VEPTPDLIQGSGSFHVNLSTGVDPTERPTAVRYEVLALACSLSMITYLDRVSFGAAGTLMAEDFGLATEGSLKGSYTAFAIAYGFFEIPSGWWGDLRGPRRVLLRIVSWWSIFTILTGLVGLRVAGVTLGGLGTLWIVRFLFGAGEAGAYPNIARALHNWFPAHERGAAQGWVWMSGRLMGGLTPLIWMLLVSGTSLTAPLLHWRVAFCAFGLIGLAWIVVFAKRFVDRPEDHPGVNQAERTHVAAGRTIGVQFDHIRVPWRAMFLNPRLWCLYLMYFCANYGWYFNITYFPGCLESRFGTPRDSLIGSLYKGGPLWLGAIGCLLGGYLTDRLLRGGMRRRWARRLPGMAGHFASASCCLAAAYSTSALGFSTLIAFSAFFNDLMMGGAWAICQDIGRKRTAVLSSCMNMAGGLGAACAGWFSGSILEHYLRAQAELAGVDELRLSPQLRVAAHVHGNTANLLIYSAIYLTAALLWLGIDPEASLEDHDK
jgi:ACS family glucarate transporter-like MFS transporter